MLLQLLQVAAQITIQLFLLFASCYTMSILAMEYSIYLINILHMLCFGEHAWWVQGFFQVLFIFGSLATTTSPPSTFVHAATIFCNSSSLLSLLSFFPPFIIQVTTWQPENISLNCKLYCIIFLFNNYPMSSMSLRVYVSVSLPFVSHRGVLSLWNFALGSCFIKS